MNEECASMEETADLRASCMKFEKSTFRNDRSSTSEMTSAVVLSQRKICSLGGGGVSGVAIGEAGRVTRSSMMVGASL